VSAPDFIGYARASAIGKRALVRALKSRVDQAYDPGTDQFRRVRQAIQREAVPDADTPGEFADVLEHAHERRRDSFRRLLEGYLNFAAEHALERHAVHAFAWSHRNLRVTVRPHLGLIVDGAPHVIRFHYARVPLARADALPMLQLLLQAGAGDHGRPSVLDLRRGALVSPHPTEAISAVLEHEADDLIRRWSAA
jgi:hypothetical protein